MSCFEWCVFFFFITPVILVYYSVECLDFQERVYVIIAETPVNKYCHPKLTFN